MDAIEALVTRKSSAMLTTPAPGKDDLKLIMQAAVRAPDHCRLRPWRFIVIEGSARDRLGRIFEEALKARDPDATEGMLQKERGKPMRAPMIIAVIARIEEHPKVPEVEQILSAGAAAQNIMIAAHALGYAGIWRTGKTCFDPHVNAALGASDTDQIVGFLYLGTTERTPVLLEEPIDPYVEIWEG